MARILIVEDDTQIRELVAETLRGEGYDVATAEDGVVALGRVIADPPDLMILDVRMPRLDGFGVLEQLRDYGLKESIKVLVVSAKTSERDREVGFELGADDYMTKPFSPLEVTEAVRRLLDLSKDELKVLREQELDTTHLLSQLESIFGG